LRPTRIARRVLFSQPIALVTGERTLNQVTAYNISRTGIFVCSPAKDYYGLQPGDVVELYWKTAKDTPVDRRAVVVRMADSKGDYPRGIGLRFDRELSGYEH